MRVNNADKMHYQEFQIPKKGGKFRNVVAPNKPLLRFQRSKLRQLQAYYLKHTKGTSVENVAHGFLKGRNVITAAKRHVGFKATIMMDISNFFDTVYKHMLPEKFSNVRQFFHKDGYAAQGFATSPLLANIASIDMIKTIDAFLTEKFDDKYAFTIYADDIQISVNTEDYNTLNGIIDNVGRLVEHAGFGVNTKKTRIKYAKFGWRRILGVNVGETEVRATRAIMRKIRAAGHQKNGSSLGGLSNWASCKEPRYKK